MTDQTALWTIMVYISGDSVLDNFAIESLKQLRDGAGDGVTVHYLFDPNYGVARPKSDSYDGDQKNTNASVFTSASKKKALSTKVTRGKNANISSADPKALTEFIDGVTPSPHPLTGADDPNRHYGLILWGHGPELLLDADPPSKNLDANQPSKDKAEARPTRNYFTPATLRDALKETKLLAQVKAGSKRGEKEAGASSRKLDFIAFDACSMSMVEAAAELQGYASFMIASQDDVPDQSFPYDKILDRLRQTSEAREACRKIPQDYKDAFRDYFRAPGPAVTKITLSSLNLQRIDDFTGLLGKLSNELRRLAYASQDARKAIIDARSASRDFVLGLYVDIFDFCENLAKKKSLGRNLISICKDICNALTVRSEKGVVLDNKTNERGGVRCHGLSVYLPYLTAEEDEKLEKSLTIGGTGIATQLSKGGSTTNLHKGGSTTNLHKSRVARISETEEDLASLDLFNEKTRWSDFIKRTWSYILAKEEPMELDLHYSAQQCVANLFSLSKASGKKGATKVGSLRVIRGGRKNKLSGKSGGPNIPSKPAA